MVGFAGRRSIGRSLLGVGRYGVAVAVVVAVVGGIGGSPDIGAGDGGWAGGAAVEKGTSRRSECWGILMGRLGIAFAFAEGVVIEYRRGGRWGPGTWMEQILVVRWGLVPRTKRGCRLR